MKKFMKSLLLLMVFLLVFSTSAFAKSENAKPFLVALGDSIPYGYNLGQTNASPSQEAFPYLMGKEADLRVRNLGVPGATTEDLLDALKNDQKYRQAVRHSDYITLNIGNNDLLRALGRAAEESENDEKKFEYLLQKYINESGVFTNLQQIIMEIERLTDSPVIIYNIYNPFDKNDFKERELHVIAERILPGLNVINRMAIQFR
ncbi:SGNH/GDSL hydrolase family protein [Alteribacter keqinensis]|uniref:Lipolytic protein G-D-S-L family n=1 Tax=Alteribacter keqinensis TaxID=2483800 RepID=A0A3M7TXH9_9BACI|nr:GDSL-type esterase/lipase family protein [Alteribacter keqinensis]RNA69991.1 lipolytic protein G-D-S-L family [Alteribacter keqinensis]